MEFQWNHYPELASTNDKAMQGITHGKLHEGAVVWTDEQSHGKGTGENLWESAAGMNLTFSLVLEPFFILPPDQFLLTQIVSLALHDVLVRRLETSVCRIKWPNDLYVSNKKIAGVLIQNLIKGSSISATVVGIGLNVNQEVFVSDAPNPVSMIHFNKKETELVLLLKEVVREIGHYYESVKENQQRKIVQQTYLNLLYRKGKWAPYSDDKGAFEGRIEDVDTFGRLRIKDRKGVLRLYAFKEVKFENYC